MANLGDDNYVRKTAIEDGYERGLSGASSPSGAFNFTADICEDEGDRAARTSAYEHGLQDRQLVAALKK
jgi:hypothetical protein